ncbi:MAG: hypothetical protein ACJ716_05420 [Marmoricola sp.]
MEEREEIEADDLGATVHGRHLVSTSKAQRQADATMARLRGERAARRRERLRESRISGRRTWNGPAEQQQ